MKNSDLSKTLRVKPIILFLFCFFLYPPTFKVFPIITYVISYGVPIIYMLFNRQYLKTFSFNQCKIILLVLAMIALSCLVPMIYDTADYSYLLVTTSFFRKGVVYLFILCMILKKHGARQAFNYFIYYFALVHVVHVIGTLILVLVPGIQSIWFSVFRKEVASLLESYGYTFRFGWQGFAGFRLTLYCTISAIFALYLRYGTKERIISVFQFIVVFLGCVIGNMFYGRSGLIITAIVSTIAIVYWNRHRIKRLIAFIGMIVILVLSINLLKDVPAFSSWYVWMSTPIVSLVTTGNPDNNSFNILQEMSQIEIPPETMVFGDGRYLDDGRYYMRTDVGYSRNILFWGLFGAFLSYGTTIYVIVELRRISVLMVIQFLIVFIIFEYKGAVYYEFIPLLFTTNLASWYSVKRNKLRIGSVKESR